MLALETSPHARANHDVEASIRFSDDFLACKAVPPNRVGDQVALKVIQRERPKARLGGNSAQEHIATPVECLAGIIGARIEGDPIA